MHVQRRSWSRSRRRGAVIAQVAVCSVVILGMGALVLDIGAMYTLQTELQVAADAAALAAASELGASAEGDPVTLARAAAQDYVDKNPSPSLPDDLLVNNEDIELGSADFDTGTGKFTFNGNGTRYDAVRVTVRRSGGGGGRLINLPFLFGPIFQKSGVHVEARAAAVLVPRDIAVVIDLSGSMSDDSELMHYKQFSSENGGLRPGIQINLRDIWCALNGPAPNYPYVPGPEDQTQYAGDTGPTIGIMSTWGSQVLPETYNPSTDPGLVYLKKSTNTTDAAIGASLLSRGYSNDEKTLLMSAAKDSSGNNWRNRVAVMLNLASWKSGRPGGKPGGDGDTQIDDDEITWAAYPTFRKTWTWADYITYVASTSNEMYYANSNFRYRFGLKTFTNFLLENQAQYNQTNILWQTPEQPLQAVKDAVQAMTDEILALQSLDQMSLEIFATTAKHEVNLSDQLQNVPTRLYQMQAAHYNSTTNIAGGMQTGISELHSARARHSSAKVIVLMSDGKPNIDEHGNFYSGGSTAIDNWTKDVARNAGNENIRIYTISVGADADQPLMTAIATLAGGQHFHAEGTPDEYSSQLQMIFRALGGRRPVALIE
jgi:hypothetical protein